MNLTAIISLYFLGLVLLLVSDFVGAVGFKFKKSNRFLQLFLGYLILIASYAVVKGVGNSIGIFVLIWVLGYWVLIHKEENSKTVTRIDYIKNSGIISLLWTIVFVLKAAYFWNFEYNCPNLLWIDNQFYMKIAEGYNLSGHENALGLRNLLFPFLDFAQPYRANDFWLVSLGLDLTTFDTIYIWELLYSTILIFVCAFSFYELAKQKFKWYLALIISVCILFTFAGSGYRNLTNLIFPGHSGGYDPIGVVAYTKLALVFALFFQFLNKYAKESKIEAIYILLLMPLLVQSTIAVFIFVFFIFAFLCLVETKSFKYFFREYRMHFALSLFFVAAVFVFYILNQNKEQMYFEYTNTSIDNNTSVIDLIMQWFKKSALLFISYYWLSIFLATILLFVNKFSDSKLRFHFFILLILCYSSAVFGYALYNKIGDSYQFATNVFGPFIICLLIYLLIQTSINSLRGKIQITLLILISVVGMNEIIGGKNFFHSTTRINYFDKKFIGEVKQTLPQLKYPLGIIYYGENLHDQSKEDFPLHDAAFLKLFGRYYDVFNIEADSLKIDTIDKSLQKQNASISRNALNIWIKVAKKTSNKKKVTNRELFYNSYPFSFCISRKPKDSLPDFIKSDVEKVMKDNNSKIYFYTLNRNYNLQKK